MANSLENKLIVSDPDFDTIKNNLKNFLRTQNSFSDYDFDGSALSNLIDLLAYNTHYMSFYANMIANEAFLDTASVRDSVVSHAKMLGYTPTSNKSAQANVNLMFTQANNASVSGMTSLTIPRFTKFVSSALDGINYIFVNLQEKTVTKSGSAFTFNNLTITEGIPVNYVFTYDELTNPNQEFELKDAGIDTTTLEVIVQNSSIDLTQTTYTLSTDATEVSANSAVYYLDETKSGKYKIYFGDGIIGKQLSDNNIVIVSYLISKGPASNKTNKFTLIDSVGGLSSGTVITNSAAVGGTFAESINKIKFAAPKAYVAQNRAVTKNDFISLILRDYPSLEAVNVWGGEENIPPVYGKVFISAKPAAGFELTTTEKQYILTNIINPISVVTVTPEFIDPDYNYLNLTIDLKYDPTATTKTPGQIETSVRSAVYNFANTYLDTFDSFFKSSRLTREIDNIETSILSNELDIKIEKRLEPVVGASSGRNYTLKYYTSLKRATGKNRIYSTPAFTSYDAEENIRDFFFEEIPLSSTGISSVDVTIGGSGFTTAPELRVIGDGFGAIVHAVITNGKISSVIVDQQGSEYTTAAIKAYDSVTGDEITSVVLQPVISNQIGKLRSYYFDSNEIKVIFSEDVGTIDYKNGIISITDFAPIDVKDPSKVLRFYATPESSMFASSKNAIITIDQDDQAATTIRVSAVTNV